MWKNLKLLLVILSVALNVAFIGVWAAQAVSARSTVKSDHGTGGARGPVWCPLLREVGVSPEQWRRIEPHLSEFQKARQGVCRKIRQARSDIIDLIASPAPDRNAIQAKQELVWTGQREVQNLLIEHLLRQKELLSPSQQKAFFDAMRKRMQMKCFGPCAVPGGQAREDASTSSSESSL